MKHDETEALEHLEQINKQRRSHNLRLRRLLKQHHDHADELFFLLCEADQPNPAEEAMREVWTRGHLDCEPDDYQSIVDYCIEALDNTGLHTATP